MHSRLFRNLITIAAAGALSACAQMTRHSNTLVFGTNTTFGIAAGTDATNVPSVTIGYKRQEAVVMPLVANTKDVDGVLEPCQVGPEFPPPQSPAALPSCMLIGRRGETLDAYSVLASFGAEFDASGTGADAKGGLAQYFATGVAAQVLALRGGAALVAVSEAATESAENPPEASLQQLLVDPKNVAAGKESAVQTLVLRGDAAAFLRGVPDKDLATETTEFEKAIGAVGLSTLRACRAGDKPGCLKAVEGGALDVVSPATLKTGLEERRKARGGS